MGRTLLLAVLCRECWHPTLCAPPAPKRCPRCDKEPRWMVLERDEPQKPWRETASDRKLLKTLRIGMVDF